MDKLASRLAVKHNDEVGGGRCGGDWRERGGEGLTGLTSLSAACLQPGGKLGQPPCRRPKAGSLLADLCFSALTCLDPGRQPCR